jgi:hypothetical protein
MPEIRWQYWYRADALPMGAAVIETQGLALPRAGSLKVGVSWRKLDVPE